MATKIMENIIAISNAIFKYNEIIKGTNKTITPKREKNRTKNVQPCNTLNLLLYFNIFGDKTINLF